MAETTDNRLRLYVERIERLLEERKGINDDIRDVYAEAKAVGYDAATIRKVIARRGVSPDDRREADAVLETYEAALGMDSAEPEQLHGPGPDAMAMATLLLAEQVEGLAEPAQAAQLVEHVLFLLDLRAEIRELRRQEGERKKLAKGEGFDAPQLALVVRWYEKVAKHGLAAMQLGEATFRQYRQTVEQRPDAVDGPVSDDPRLAALFAPPPPKQKSKVKGTVARMAKLAQLARRAQED